MSRTAFTAKLAMASRLSMVAAMVTVLPCGGHGRLLVSMIGLHSALQ